MAESSESHAFESHSMKAELFNEMVQAVNRIFEEREAHVAGLERRALQANLVSQRKLIGEMSRNSAQLENKLKQIESANLTLTMRIDKNEQQLQMTTSGLQVLSALVDGHTARMEGEFEQMRLLSTRQSEQFQNTYNKLMNNIKHEEQKWNGWYMQLVKTASTHQRLIDDTLAGQKLLSDQVTSQNQRLLAMQQYSNISRTTAQNHQRELTRLVSVQRSLQRLHLQSAENSSKVRHKLPQLKELQNFIEKYQPIYTYAQVSDLMFAVMDDKLRKKLQEIDKRTLAEFSIVTSTDRGIPNLRRKVITSTETINRIMLRNKPYEQLQECNEAQQMQNYYQQKLDRQIQQLTERLEKQLKDLQKTVSKKLEETTKQVTLEFNQSTQMVGFRMSKAEDRIELISQHIRKWTDELKAMKKDAIVTESKDQLQIELERKPGTALSDVDFGLKLEQITKRMRQNRYHRRETSNEGNRTQRYEGVHKNFIVSELSSISSVSNCLIPDNVVEMRRKSLIDMRRTKILPSSRAEARP